MKKRYRVKVTPVGGCGPYSEVFDENNASCLSFCACYSDAEERGETIATALNAHDELLSLVRAYRNTGTLAESEPKPAIDRRADELILALRVKS